MSVTVVYTTLPVSVYELVRMSVPQIFATIRLESQWIKCMFCRGKYVCRLHLVYKLVIYKLSRQKKYAR
jgi:hypothetical protein